MGKTANVGPIKWVEANIYFNRLKKKWKNIDGEDFNAQDFHVLRRMIFNMCMQKEPHNYRKRLYDKYLELSELYILVKIFPCFESKNGEVLLRKAIAVFQALESRIDSLISLFDCLDRAKPGSLLEASRQIFVDKVSDRNDVRTAVLNMVHQDRAGKPIDKDLLIEALTEFVENSQGSGIEHDLLEDARKSYSEKASVWILNGSCRYYMLESEKILNGEDMDRYYYPSSTKVKLLEIARSELLVTYSCQLHGEDVSGHKGVLHDLLQKAEMGDISRIFRLYSFKKEYLEIFARIFKQHVITNGLTVIEHAEHDTSSKTFLARNAIVLHSRYAEYVEICFNNHYIFDKAFFEAMEELCNNAKNAMGKSLVIFCSKLLEKGGSEKPIDGDIEKTLEKVISFTSLFSSSSNFMGPSPTSEGNSIKLQAVHLLSFIRNKDFYAKFYRQTLARRLLLGLSANEEHEIFILTKLKKHFGWHFTNKLERMILDLSLSKELQKAYDKYLSGNPPADPGIDLTVNVLTKGIWPVFPAYDLRLPTELVKCAEVYTQHYNSTMTRRKISWMNSLGTCTIRVNWEGETRELVVTACQASLLWLFNNNDTLNYSEIVEGLNFKGDVISLLYSLIHEDFNILKKIPPSDYISSTDSFEFNGHFRDKRENMMITFGGIEKGNAQDWSDTIDACIVRVMKQARILESDQLMKLCAAELSRMFKLDSRTFGIQIAGLIYQGFLERDGDRYGVLKYVTE